MSTTEPRTTLATVAASAGVSIATVSKVLNGRRDVAPATRARVQEMLRTHDYGGRLKTIEQHPTIELTFRGKIGCYSSEIVQGVAAAAAELGVAVTIGVKSVDQRPSASLEAGTWARNLAINGRRAVIAVTDELGHEEIAALARMRLPLVVIDPMNVPRATSSAWGRPTSGAVSPPPGTSSSSDTGASPISAAARQRSAARRAWEAFGPRSRRPASTLPEEYVLQHPGLPLRGRDPGGSPAPVARASGRPRSSQPVTSSPEAPSRRHARSACPCPTTSASSASTTPRSPASPHPR